MCSRNQLLHKTQAGSLGSELLLLKIGKLSQLESRGGRIVKL